MIMLSILVNKPKVRKYYAKDSNKFGCQLPIVLTNMHSLHVLQRQSDLCSTTSERKFSWITYHIGNSFVRIDNEHALCLNSPLPLIKAKQHQIHSILCPEYVLLYLKFELFLSYFYMMSLT